VPWDADPIEMTRDLLGVSERYVAAGVGCTAW